ncbi:hypothetical protein J7I80_05235 [Bacillus sp. ISL-41]|uniref:hypothetical protein n=1 Tax=Bacillus sp. ISL-41 TaxID=2819127 RepID=UPI001BE96734|nr:hypothetical protein [Bacillus sp. ISL-41]MBT2641616.1 hypothetical protein [Bacillus sp. ISL-41]
MNSNENMVNHLTTLRESITAALEIENLDYYRMLLERSGTSIKSAEVLINNNLSLDVPVLLRVVFEHISRIYLSKKYGDEIFKGRDSAFQMMGIGPSLKKIYEDFGDEFKVIYEILSSFAHPDMMGLLMNRNNKKDMIMESLIGLIIPSIKKVLSESYVDINIDSLNLANEVLQNLLFLIPKMNDHIEASDWQKQMLVMKEHPFGQAPFRRVEMNKEVEKLTTIALKNPEEAKHIFNSMLQDLEQTIYQETSRRMKNKA